MRILDVRVPGALDRRQQLTIKAAENVAEELPLDWVCVDHKDCHGPEIWPKKAVEVVFALKASKLRG